MSIAKDNGYSATVTAELHVGGRVFELAQVGPDHCILRSPQEIAAEQAEIVVTVDGHVQRRSVELIQPISSETTLVRFQANS